MTNNNAQNKENDLFKLDVDSELNACIEFYGRDWNLYATGYREAGDIIAKDMIESTGTVDTLVYPMIFLYRQYIELRLKDIIINGNRLIHGKFEYQWGHKINELWDKAKDILRQIDIDAKQSTELENLERCINQFSEIDRLSYAFRYPEDKHEKYYLSGISHINVRNFHEIIEDISSTLDAISTYLSESLSFKWESQSDYEGG